jgi:hypothetical protein
MSKRERGAVLSLEDSRVKVREDKGTCGIRVLDSSVENRESIEMIKGWMGSVKGLYTYRLSGGNRLTIEDVCYLKEFDKYFGYVMGKRCLLRGDDEWDIEIYKQYRPMVVKGIVYPLYKDGKLSETIFIGYGESLNWGERVGKYYYVNEYRDDDGVIKRRNIYLNTDVLVSNGNIDVYNVLYVRRRDKKKVNITTFYRDMECVRGDKALNMSEVACRDKHITLIDVFREPLSLQYMFMKKKINTINNLIKK